MTTHYIETVTEDGQSIRIEVEETVKSSAGFTRQNPQANLSSEAVKDAYEQALATIRGCADGVVATLQDLTPSPSSASIEFSIKVDAEAGSMVAKTRETGQFKVSLSWKQPEPENEK